MYRIGLMEVCFHNEQIPIVFYLIANWRTTTNNGHFYRIIISRVKKNIVFTSIKIMLHIADKLHIL